ncbi:MAG TPA: outer membrane protein assembly factor BamB [Gammaproteobacteria bacterium]|nr:outer membrane protein assembly factor BamB [Gammaproteobacteria bacterium]
MKKLLGSLTIALLVAACASDNVEPPALLTPILKPRYDISEMWLRYISSSDAVLRMNLAEAADDHDVYIATYNGSIYAFSLKSGYTDWHVKMGLTLSAGPTVKDGMLVVASAGGTILSLDPKSGATLWKTELNGEVLGKPAIGSGSVVIRTTDGRIVALAADTGEQRWKITYEEPRLTLRGACDPVIVDRVVYDGLDNGKLVALNLDDGSQLWEATVTLAKGSDELSRLTDVDGVLAVEGDIIYAIGYRGELVAVSRPNGQVLWSRDLSSYTGVSADGDHLYVTDLHSAVWELEKSNGVPIWTQPVLRAHDLTLPVPFHDSLVMGGIEGDFHFMSKNDGTLMARAQLDSDPILTPPLVVGNEVVVMSTGGHVGAYLVTPVPAK